MEMPNYKFPRIKDVFYTVFEKSKSFVVEAGKIILAISVILWVLATNGIGDKFENPGNYITENVQEISQEEIQTLEASIKLENSFIGYIGKGIEPLFKPLGYDWKIELEL